MVWCCDSEDHVPTAVGEKRFLQCCLLDLFFWKLQRTSDVVSLEGSRWGFARARFRQRCSCEHKSPVQEQAWMLPADCLGTLWMDTRC